jgi:hypothetical protein
MIRRNLASDEEKAATGNGRNHPPTVELLNRVMNQKDVGLDSSCLYRKTDKQVNRDVVIITWGDHQNDVSPSSELSFFFCCVLLLTFTCSHVDLLTLAQPIRSQPLAYPRLFYSDSTT